ncbi:MAG: hypothetical protein FWD46_06395 [Cystobacterineae bacterium]|nr:hypothetical protein [Cystobacterineae bacterium]
MLLFLLLFKTLPAFFLSLMAFPIGFCYFLFSKKSRTQSQRFLKRWAAFAKTQTTDGKVPRLSALQHIVAFALTLVEKTQAWGGRVPFERMRFHGEDVRQLWGGLEKGKGAVMLCSHLGNVELLRALADARHIGVSKEVGFISVMDNVSPSFARLLHSLNPRSSLKILPTQNMGPATIFALQEEIQNGGLVFVAADRTSAQNPKHFFSLPFLGANAPFPHGPFLLAALLQAPVYAVFALRQKPLSPLPNYNLYIYRLHEGLQEGQPELSRKQRYALMHTWAQKYAALLQSHLVQQPYQWYNFYEFWE